jgi:hypothetical protein
MEPIATPGAQMRPVLGMLHQALLVCGILSSLLYVFANIITVMHYQGYDIASQTVSELSAIDAPTRALWVGLLSVYSLLLFAFGWGLWQSGIVISRLRLVGILFIANAVIGFFWPPMHQREVLAAGGGTLSDTLHIVFTVVTVPLMMLAIGFGAGAFGKGFRYYSWITLAILLVAGVLTGLDGPKISKNLPTPWIGIWERINIGVYLLWIVVLAVKLLSAEKKRTPYGRLVGV